MSKQEILQNVYNQLRAYGAVRNRQDFAERIGYNYTCTSAAFNGAERYLNDRFFTRILRAFPQVSEEYIRTGQEPVLILSNEASDEDESQVTGINPFSSNMHRLAGNNEVDLNRVFATLREQQELIRHQQAQTERALEQIDNLIGIIRTLTRNADAK